MPGPGLLLSAVRDEAVEHLVGGTSVDLRGQKGSGRSMLVAAITSELVERGWDVVRVQAVATLKDRPLEALAVADLARRTDQRDASAVSAAVRRVARAVADGRTVLAVDDADDLDQASAGAITVAHARGAFPVLSTTRPRPERVRDPFVLPSEVRPGVQVVVPPLGYLDVHALLGETLPGQLDPDVVARVYTASGGLPGLAVAIAVAARRGGLLRQVDGVWRGAADLWSPGLVRAVQPLVADLDPAGIEALQILSLAGTMAVSTAVELVGWDALEDIDACGLLRVAPQGDQLVVGVYPPLVEDRYRHLPIATRRLRLQDKIDALLAASPGAIEPASRTRSLSAPWFDAASDDGVPPGIDPRAGMSATVLDRLMHDEWHRRVLIRQREWERERSARTAVPYLRALLIGNADPRVMRDVIDRTPRSSEPADMAAFDRWHAHVLAFAEDDVAGAHALLRRSIPEAGVWSEQLEGLDKRLTLLFDRVPSWVEDDRSVAALPPDARQFLAAAKAECLVTEGRPRQALALLEQGPATDPDVITLRAVMTGLARLVDGDARAALAWSLRHLEQARADLDADALPGHAYVAVCSLLMLGRVEQARTLLGTVLSTGLTSSLQRHFTSALLENAAGLARYDGFDPTAATLAAQAEATATGPAAFPIATSNWPTMRPKADGGDAADADQLWASALDLLERGFVVSAAIRAGTAIGVVPDPDRVAALRAAVGPAPSPLVDATVRVAEASVDPDEMVGIRLGHELVGAGQVALAARAFAATIQRLRGSGRSRKATDLLHEARELLLRAEAEPDVLLGSLSLRPDLTPRELEIGKLVADGRSNGQIADHLGLTVKTVENHVNRLLRKLGVRDRQAVERALNA